MKGSDGNPPLPFWGICLESGDLKGDQFISRLILTLVGHDHKDAAIFGNRGIARPGVTRSAQFVQFAYANVSAVLGIQQDLAHIAIHQQEAVVGGGGKSDAAQAAAVAILQRCLQFHVLIVHKHSVRAVRSRAAASIQITVFVNNNMAQGFYFGHGDGFGGHNTVRKGQFYGVRTDDPANTPFTVGMDRNILNTLIGSQNLAAVPVDQGGTQIRTPNRTIGGRLNSLIGFAQIVLLQKCQGCAVVGIAVRHTAAEDVHSFSHCGNIVIKGLIGDNAFGKGDLRAVECIGTDYNRAGFYSVRRSFPIPRGIYIVAFLDGKVQGGKHIRYCLVGGITADGQATVWYAAFDRSGNVAKASRTVQYTDYEQPRFCLTGPLLFPAGSTFDVLDVMRADDLLDGNISHRVRATSLSEQALSGPGTYGVLFQVSNSLGDTCSLTLNAELYPTGSYNADLKLTDYLIYLPVGSSFDPEDYLLSFRHSVKPVELRRGVPEEYQLDITGTVDTDTPGVYEVDYVLSYESGTQIYVGRSRLAVVVEE